MQFIQSLCTPPRRVNFVNGPISPPGWLEVRAVSFPEDEAPRPPGVGERDAIALAISPGFFGWQPDWGL